jgi:hypothetical protein
MAVFVPELVSGGNKNVSPRRRFRQNLLALKEEDWPRVCVMTAVYIVGGGVLTWLIGQDAVTHRQAFTYGLGWPTALKGVGEGLYVGANIVRRR